MKELSESYKKRLLELSGSKKEEDQDIHLPELTMKKKDLIEYLEKLYNILLK